MKLNSLTMVCIVCFIRVLCKEQFMSSNHFFST